MTEWIEKKISELGTVVGGATPSTKDEQNYIDGSIPWITPKDLAGFRGRYISRGERSITQKGLASCSAQMMPKHSVLFTSRAPIGYVAISVNPVCTNQGFKSVVPNENTDYLFLYYLLKFYKDKIEALGSGTTFKEVSGTTMKNIVVRVPKEKEKQREIGLILSSIDDKIEANEKINHNLQQQIQALFSAWFCTFEPFGGTVPSNWSTRNLSEIAEFVGGYAYKGNELMKSTTVMATIKNFERTGGFKLDGFKEIRPSNKLKSTQRLALYDILVAHTDLTQNAEVIGNAEMVMSLLDYHDAIFSMDLVKVVPKPGCLSQFLVAALLQNRVFKAHCLGYVNGTTVLHLSKKALPEYKLLLPNDLSVLSPLDKAITALYLQISANIEENSRLELLRETLLPQLMSGEIDVSNIKL